MVVVILFNFNFDFKFFLVVMATWGWLLNNYFANMTMSGGVVLYRGWSGVAKIAWVYVCYTTTGS